MMKNNSFRLRIILFGTLLAAACDSASPTGPTTTEPEPEPEAVMLTGNWRGTFDGMFIASDAVTAELTQTDTAVTGTWSTPMPALLVTFGAPANVPLSGLVAGTVTGTTAELAFGFLDIPAFREYFAEGCALSLTVSSFTATTMDGTWATNMSCQPRVSDSGDMMLTRQ